jgi:5'-nucleotidase
MRILLSNDDGITAPGLAILEGIARALSDDVWVVAPETDQSGKGHSLSLHDPVRVRDLGDRRYAVSGTPTDCVIMGVRQILDRKPDLILSGINRGANIADDVTYSGTVACAMEGTILGIQSIALSQTYSAGDRSVIDWSSAETHGRAIIERILAIGIPPGVLMNVNFPAVPAADVTGVEITAQCTAVESLIDVEKRIDARLNPYYWIRYRRSWDAPAEGSDMWAISKGAISVTPLRLDLTDRSMLDALKAGFAEQG